MEIRRVPLTSLDFWPQNARAHGPENLEAIKGSLLRFGQAEPLVVQATTKRVIGGNGRLVAMRELAWSECDIVELEIDDTKAAALGLALNRSASLGSWNEPVLAEVLKSLEAQNSLDGVGFSAEDLGALLDKLKLDSDAGDGDFDFVPEPPAQATTRRGDLWLLGEHRLLCGDSASPIDLDRLLDRAPVHLVNTDPPYNVKVEPRSNNAIAAGLSSFTTTHHQKLDVERHPGKAQPTTARLRAKDRPLQNDFMSDAAFAEILGKWFGNLGRVLLPGRGFYLWGGYSNLANYPRALKDAGLYFSQAIIWVKGHPVLTRKDFMGDHEWCQPADTSVLTPDGLVPIGSLRDGDRVTSFRRADSMLTGRRGAIPVRRAERPYRGRLLGIRAGGKETWCTPAHIWSVKLAPHAAQLWCVYLMRRGRWWRIGKSMFLSSAGFGVKHRIKTERGEQAWILSVHGSNLDATIHEQVCQARYGIPTTTWNETYVSRRALADVARLYDLLDLDVLEAGAERALRDHGRELAWPFLDRTVLRDKVGRRVPLTVRASNVLPGVMMVPVPVREGASHVPWMLVDSVGSQPFDGSVHSLDVPGLNHYVANGIVTHNCFYGWREGAAHEFFGPNNVTDVWEVKKVNPQSMIHLCLHPEAAVLTEAGFRPIRSLKVGDRVFTGDGTFHDVANVSSHRYTSEHLYRITAKGGNATTEASDNHPFLIWRPSRRGTAISGGDVAWIRADEVKVGDYTMTPILAEPEADPRPEWDEDAWFLFGLYLAQGHLQSAGHGDRRYPVFSIHKKRQDLAERIWRRWPKAREYDPNDYSPMPSSGLTVMAFDGDAGERFEALGGRLAHGKRLAPEIFALPRSKRLAVLHGWLNGDGCRVHDRAYWQGNTVSPDLAAHLSLLAESVGYRSNVYSYDPPDEFGGIGGRRFKSQRRVYYLYFYERGQFAKRGASVWMQHEGREYALRYVKRVEQVRYEGDVWNLSIDGHPSFQTAVGLSHNTEKPVELATRAVLYSSRRGEHVLDLFGGSGSTLVACEQAQRRAFLMEIDPLYCDVILARWTKLFGSEPRLAASGQTYSEVAAERGTGSVAPATSGDAGADP